MIFVTGCNAGFFNTLLITLQSFAEAIPDHPLLVCDFGLHPQQAQYLRAKGQLLERPADLPMETHVLGALLRYLQNSNHYQSKNEMVIWVDADLTLIDVSIDDFKQVLQKMDQHQYDVAACSTGSTIEEMSNIFVDPSVLSQFKGMIQSSHIDAKQPYFSVGIFFCRSEQFLRDWDERSSRLEFHPLYEQNVFNIVLQEHKTPYLDLDIDEWQVQGSALDQVLLQPKSNGRAAGKMGDKSIKILHTTSPLPNHLWVGRAKLQVQDVQIVGILKLIAARPVTELQLNLLASYIATHKQALFNAGLVSLAPSPIDGYEFAPIPDGQNPVMSSAPAMRQ